MKTRILSATLLAISASVILVAAPLKSNTPVHTRPDRSSPPIATLPAGTEPMPANSTLANTPAGWMAVELSGPFEGYVEHKDLTKGLDVKAGVEIRVAPKPDAAVLTIAEKGDKTSITGTRGKWTQISLEKKLIGFIPLGASSGPAPSVAAASAAPGTAAAARAPMAPAPVTPGVYGVATPGQASAMVNLGDGGSSTLPRQFAGRFVSTRRPFTPRRPYDYALNDDAGKRYAYLDISKLLLTEQIDNYIDHPVVVFGAAKNAPDSKDIVIQVESLRLK